MSPCKSLLPTIALGGDPTAKYSLQGLHFTGQAFTLQRKHLKHGYISELAECDTTIMILQTDRLNFRQVSTDDINNIHELHSLPETDRFNTLGIPDTIQVTEKVIKEWLAGQTAKPQTSYIFCLDLVDTEQFIGLIALSIGKPNYKTAEVWFKIHKDFWKKGYTTEALTKLIDFGFNDLALHRIEAGCAVENIASSRVLEKVGMTKEGMKRKKLPIRGEWKDSYFYGILEEDFNKKDQL